MATKQFGRLKLHWSKRGFAFKWGDGEIHRLSFGQSESAAAGQQPEGGYDPNDPNAGEYGGYGRGYDRGYDQGEYPGQEQDGYEPGVGYADEGAPAGRYDVLYRSDWLTWLLLVVLPPLGIWILWRRERLEQKPRLIVSGVAAVWFIVLLIWIFSAIFSQGADPTMGVGTIKAPESIVVGATATPAPTGIQTGDLPSGTLDITTTPAPAAQATPRPGGSSGSSNSGTSTSDDGSFDETADTSGAAEDPDTTYIWSSTSDSYYHKTETCTNITGTPSRISMDIARSRGQTACPVCYGAQNTGTTYYANKGGRYYHKDKTCSGMKNAQAVTRSQAVKAGKKPCPVCIGSYYATKSGKYYHTKSNCSGMQGAQLVTKAAAVKARKLPCPVCVKKTSSKSGTATKTRAYYSTAAGKYYHVNPTCSGMKNAQKVTLATTKKRGQKPCPVCIGSSASSSGTVYYATTAGKYYHTKANCSGMKNARKITLATAKTKGKQPCPVCVKASGSYVYATSAGKYYHSNPACSGMKDARKVTLATAKKAGKTACPVCMKKSATTSFYSTVGGKYYHAKASCSGMKNATKVTLATAKKRGQTPCPVCLTKQAKAAADAKATVYATSGGKFYHVKATCSGMKNARRVTVEAAKSSGKTPCPVCMKSKANPSATFVYAKLSGKYYHKGGCNTSDADGAKKVALTTARKYGKTACPVCFKRTKRETTRVYVTPAGLKYHSKVDCSGIHNTMKISLKTALARKYVRCTVCDAPKA